MTVEQLLEVIFKYITPLVILGYIVIKGIKIAESMAKSLSTMNRELGEIKQILQKKNVQNNSPGK